MENGGFCPVCRKSTRFVSHDPWLRDHYVCVRCGSVPRHRALAEVLERLAPRWRRLRVHESSPGLSLFSEQCRRYSCSSFEEGVKPGETVDGRRCENLEALTFPGESFDVFITQDVLEHVYHPDRALREVMRVLAPGGLHVFTAPKHRTRLVSRPRVELRPDGTLLHLEPAEYHGNPIGDGRSLVTWDYGADFDDLIRAWSGYEVSTYVLRDRALGIAGEFLEVFAIRKDEANRIG